MLSSLHLENSSQNCLLGRLGEMQVCTKWANSLINAVCSVMFVYYGKWFEPMSLSHLCDLIVWVRVVPRRTVVGDIDQRFDNLSGSHHQSHVNRVLSVYGIYVSVEP